MKGPKKLKHAKITRTTVPYISSEKYLFKTSMVIQCYYWHYIKIKNITLESILQMFYYTGQNENKYTVIYDFTVAKRCLSNLGIHVSISFTPAFRNSSFNNTFEGRLSLFCSRIGNAQAVWVIYIWEGWWCRHDLGHDLVSPVTIPMRWVEGCWQGLNCILSHFCIKDIRFRCIVLIICRVM